MIATPPESRLPIKTYISRWEKNLIKEAFQREINRGGQILFVHNKINDIENISEQLRNIFPDLSIEIAHGQMRERKLEQIMMRFYNNEFSVLLATTIIESGLDIPNANTIIINNANRFGLAQLHQLRGRVGRSERQSYAYLLTPPKNQISEDGLKRLEAIEAIEDLGVGFILAMHDLEIRGAGEILGDEQSGQIQKIGFTLYKDLLSEAVSSLKDYGTPDESFFTTDINLNIPTLIPEDYMPDVHLRLIFYKRISSTDSDSQIKEIKHELMDRFGTVPEFTSNLLEVTKLKNKANSIGIKRIKLNNQYGRIYFHSSTTIESDLLIQLIKENHDKFRLYPDQSLGFKGDFLVSIEKIKEIKELLNYLTSGQAPKSTH
jgi:transcription-repair coupling factor (superfamily II helicase)